MIRCEPLSGLAKSVTAMWRFCQAWQRSTPNWLVKFLKQHLYCYNYSIVYFALHVGGVRVHFMGTWIFGMFMKCVRVMPLVKFSNIVAMRRLMNLHIYLSSDIMWDYRKLNLASEWPGSIFNFSLQWVSLTLVVTRNFRGPVWTVNWYSGTVFGYAETFHNWDNDFNCCLCLLLVGFVGYCVGVMWHHVTSCDIMWVCMVPGFHSGFHGNHSGQTPCQSNATGKLLPSAVSVRAVSRAPVWTVNWYSGTADYTTMTTRSTNPHLFS